MEVSVWKSLKFVVWERIDGGLSLEESKICRLGKDCPDDKIVLLSELKAFENNLYLTQT